MKNRLFIFVSICVFAVVFCWAIPNGDTWASTTRETLYGEVQGFEDAHKTWAWLGIPYALPPVDDLRWRPAQDPTPWEGTLQTTVYSDQCTQYAGSGSIVGNEDCLYLNIWRPQTSETGLPVYFYIHGGGNQTGSASNSLFNGAALAGGSDIVVVTINYRIGPFGWFAHPALRYGDLLGDSGNFGTMDIIQALRWVQDNIAFFGGEPGNITIVGQSAGATNVISLLISPLASGLFHKAIAQSMGKLAHTVAEGEASAHDAIINLFINDGSAATPAEAEQLLGQMTLIEIEDYLRSKTADQILKAYPDFVEGYTDFIAVFTDGAVVHSGGFYEAVTLAEYNQVPMILGTNKEEQKVYMANDHLSYPSDRAYQKEAETLSDSAWKVFGVDDPAKALINAPSQPDVFAYQFLYGSYHYRLSRFKHDIVPDGVNAWLTKPVNFALMLGSCHGLENPFFWGNYEFKNWGSFIFMPKNREGYRALSKTMRAYVSQFMRGGDPGSVDGVLWSPWSNTDGESKRILFDADSSNVLIQMAVE